LRPYHDVGGASVVAIIRTRLAPHDVVAIIDIRRDGVGPS
jgi:hypothetical protein